MVFYNKAKGFLITLLLLLFLVFLLPELASARIGVGVGAGKIQIDEDLRAGRIYTLPPLPVINTGDQPGEYGVTVEYHENAKEMRPDAVWFHFEPQLFHLDATKAQIVDITLTLPTKVTPGDYFAYLEAQPVKTDVAGVTSIGVAAAAKLYFTIAPSNIFQGIYYRFISLYALYHPWDTIILGFIAIFLLLHFLNKRFKIQIAKK